MDLRDIPFRLFDEFGRNSEPISKPENPVEWLYSAELEKLFTLARVAETESPALILTLYETQWMITLRFVPASLRPHLYPYAEPTSITNGVVAQIEDTGIWAVDCGRKLKEAVNFSLITKSREEMNDPLIGDIFKRYCELVRSPAIEATSFWEAERYPEGNYSKPPR